MKAKKKKGKKPVIDTKLIYINSEDDFLGSFTFEVLPTPEKNQKNEEEKILILPKKKVDNYFGILFFIRLWVRFFKKICLPKSSVFLDQKVLVLKKNIK